jgi:hypothetical protein
MELAPDFDEFIACLIARGVEWGDAWADKVEGPLGRHRVSLLGRETFLRNKRAAGRPKDLADIEALRSGDE